MGRLRNDITQKFLPSAKKMLRIRFRRKNGRWVEFDVPPSKKSFVFGKDKDQSYQLEGTPDIEDETGQREYMFFEGVSYPIKSHNQHPELLVMGREAVNQQLLLIQAEERGYQKAMLLKNKNKPDLMLYVLIAIVINVLVSLGIGFMLISG